MFTLIKWSHANYPTGRYTAHSVYLGSHVRALKFKSGVHQISVDFSIEKKTWCISLSRKPFQFIDWGKSFGDKSTKKYWCFNFSFLLWCVTITPHMLERDQEMCARDIVKTWHV